MGYLKQFDVSYSGLAPGKYDFQYVIEKKFFDELSYSLIKDAQAFVNVELTRHQNMLLFDFTIEAKINTTCDRCLIDCNLPFKQTNKLVVKFGDGESEDPDEVIVSPKETEINLASYICEYINLMPPLNLVACEIDSEYKSECNQEVLNKLNELAVPEPETQVDPRWAALEKLRKN